MAALPCFNCRLRRCSCWLLIAVAASASVVAAVGRPVAANPPAGKPIRSFVNENCYDCHQGEYAEAGLDLSALADDLSDAGVQMRWVQVFDRVHDGEMPPPDASDVAPKDRAEFLQATGDWLRTFQRSQNAELGRVHGRRLTRREVERSLHDLLGIDIPLANQLPEESQSAEFTTVADSQSMSHFHLQRHLAVVDVALDEAFRRALTPKDRYKRDFSAKKVARRQKRKRTREPEIIDGQAVVWSSNLIYYGRIPATRAPESGWYRFKVRVSGLKLPKTGGVWSTVHSGLCVSSAPLLAWVTAFEATDQVKQLEFEAWLPERHMLEIRPGDATLKKAKFKGGQVGNGEGGPQNVPGIAIDRVTMERIHRGPDDDGVRRLLFGDLEVERQSLDGGFTLVADVPRHKVDEQLISFARRAFRRPVSRDDISGYLDIVHAALEVGAELDEALRIGYRAILCSPRFLYVTESSGPLDDHAIAARLSYMLNGTTPDGRLSRLADAGRLHRPVTIRKEIDRLLAGSGGRTFVEDFAADWLDLDQIDATEPDRRQFRNFDPIVKQSMLDETHAFLETMLHDDLSVAHLIETDFTFLNSRLARYYEIDSVKGDELRRVALRPQHHRGGVLTHGAILKVTANGTNTSPVIRGVWVSEKLLGEKIPPPPAGVPAIEPDIRGAETIRQMLAKHRSDDSCARCHVKIDPPGFALENYDPAGRWRDRYRKRQQGGRRPKIDASYALADGREFRSIDEFRTLVASEPRPLAHNVAEKLIVYGTGAPVSFADRPDVEQIVDQAADNNYGFRRIVQAVVTSPLFLNK